MAHEPPALIGTRGRFTDNPPDHENVVPSLINSPPWVDGVYVNIRNTSDKVPILMHDSTVDRTTDGSGSVSSLTLAQIKMLDAGAGAEVPTLADYLQAIVELDADTSRRPLSRIFLQPRSLEASAIAATYAMATDPAFESIISRYEWTFNLGGSVMGANNLRTLDATAPIASFFGPFTAATGPELTATIVELANDVDARAILAFPASVEEYPDALNTLAANGFETGISRLNDLARIAPFYRNELVRVLFTWRTDEVVYWNQDAPLSGLTGHGTGERGDPSHVLG